MTTTLTAADSSMRTKWGMRIIAALGFAGLMTASVHAADINVPVALAKGQVYEVEMTAKARKSGAADEMNMTMRGEWRVVGADSKGFVVEEKTISIDVPPASANMSPQEKISAKIAETVSSVLTKTTTRIQTDKNGAPEKVVNIAEVRSAVAQFKGALLDSMIQELSAMGLPQEQAATVRGAVDQMITQTYLSSDDVLAANIMETFSRFTLPMGMMLSTDAVLTYGNPATGQFAEDGTAGSIRVTAYDASARRLDVVWEQHYSPALLQDQVNAIAAAMAQAIPDKTKLQEELAKLKVNRVDTVTYDIDPTTGQPRSLTVRETVSVNGREGKVTTKEIKVRRR